MIHLEDRLGALRASSHIRVHWMTQPTKRETDEALVASASRSGPVPAHRDDRFESLDFADRWLGDGFRVTQENAPGFMLWLDVEMTHARAAIDRLRQLGFRASYPGVVVRAAGLALSRHPDLHTVLSGGRRLKPAHVRIGLSVANETVAAPVLRLDAVEQKPLHVLCEEIVQRAPEARADDSRTLALLRRWGWLVPFGWMRRLILRVAFSSLRFRHLFGSLQVTVLQGVDAVASLACGAPAVLAMGSVRERVVVRGGQPAVRLMATLVCTGDHKVYDGERIARIMSEVQRVMESGELLDEVERTAMRETALVA
jgi:pyruvate dehydrogenase E2 component (dihydrolipoamide acetyltransferase)